MAIENVNAGATRMEASDGATGVSAQSQGQSYEQVTEFLKSQSAPAETPVAEPEPPAAEPTETSEVAPSAPEEFARLSPEQLEGLPPEVQSHLKRVHRDYQAAFTRKTQALAEERRKLAQAPPPPPSAPAPPAQPGAQPTVPPDYVEMRRKLLPAEMQWLAESLAMGDYQRDQAFQQRFIAPMAQTLQAQMQASIQATYQSAQEDFSGRNPGWEAHEDEMVDVVKFLQSKDLKHPVWGNKLDLLYRLVNGVQVQQQATQQTLERTAQAVRAKSTVSGPAGRATVPDTDTRIRSAKTDREALELVKATMAGTRR